ncbi:MAG: hypothetical protein Q9207_005905 [Kuettlingeria erythrocarpa]
MLHKSQYITLHTWGLLLSAQLITNVATNPLPANEINPVPPGTPRIAATLPPEVPVNTSSSLSVTLPPSDFTIEATVGTVKLDRRGVFPLTIVVLGLLAGLSPNDQVKPRDYRARDITGMSLATSGIGPQGRVLAQHLIWGLILAIKYMKDRQNFRNWRFTLRWQGNIVGTLLYLYKDAHDSIGAPEALSAMDLLQANTSISAPPGISVDNLRTVVSIRPVEAVVIDYDDAMMAVAGGMADLAAHRMNEHVVADCFYSNWLPYAGTFALYSTPPVPASLQPDWFKYHFVSLVLAKLAITYSSPRSTICRLPYRMVCCTAYIAMLSNGDAVGGGFLTNRHIPLVGAVDQTANITSS